ncbi:MAG: hypothetical protein RL139_672, partial [Gemmatimonadota bacterium]
RMCHAAGSKPSRFIAEALGSMPAVEAVTPAMESDDALPF